nr:hypothetical chloroplast RF1 [Entransia fimbriata]WKT05707.1 hypothetical chloroplast RF1 [Entransia fimbriata]
MNENLLLPLIGLVLGFLNSLAVHPSHLLAMRAYLFHGNFLGILCISAHFIGQCLTLFLECTEWGAFLLRWRVLNSWFAYLLLMAGSVITFKQVTGELLIGLLISKTSFLYDPHLMRKMLGPGVHSLRDPRAPLYFFLCLGSHLLIPRVPYSVLSRIIHAWSFRYNQYPIFILSTLVGFGLGSLGFHILNQIFKMSVEWNARLTYFLLRKHIHKAVNFSIVILGVFFQLDHWHLRDPDRLKLSNLPQIAHVTIENELSRWFPVLTQQRLPIYGRLYQMKKEQSLSTELILKAMVEEKVHLQNQRILSFGHENKTNRWQDLRFFHAARQTRNTIQHSKNGTFHTSVAAQLLNHLTKKPQSKYFSWEKHKNQDLVKQRFMHPIDETIMSYCQRSIYYSAQVQRASTGWLNTYFYATQDYLSDEPKIKMGKKPTLYETNTQFQIPESLRWVRKIVDEKKLDQIFQSLRWNDQVIDARKPFSPPFVGKTDSIKSLLSVYSNSYIRTSSESLHDIFSPDISGVRLVESPVSLVNLFFSTFSEDYSIKEERKEQWEFFVDSQPHREGPGTQDIVPFLKGYKSEKKQEKKRPTGVPEEPRMIWQINGKPSSVEERFSVEEVEKVGGLRSPLPPSPKSDLFIKSGINHERPPGVLQADTDSKIYLRSEDNQINNFILSLKTKANSQKFCYSETWSLVLNKSICFSWAQFFLDLTDTLTKRINLLNHPPLEEQLPWCFNSLSQLKIAKQMENPNKTYNFKDRGLEITWKYLPFQPKVTNKYEANQFFSIHQEHQLKGQLSSMPTEYTSFPFLLIPVWLKGLEETSLKPYKTINTLSQQKWVDFLKITFSGFDKKLFINFFHSYKLPQSKTGKEGWQGDYDSIKIHMNKHYEYQYSFPKRSEFPLKNIRTKIIRPQLGSRNKLGIRDRLGIRNRTRHGVYNLRKYLSRKLNSATKELKRLRIINKRLKDIDLTHRLSNPRRRVNRSIRIKGLQLKIITNIRRIKDLKQDLSSKRDKLVSITKLKQKLNKHKKQGKESYPNQAWSNLRQIDMPIKGDKETLKEEIERIEGIEGQDIQEEKKQLKLCIRNRLFLINSWKTNFSDILFTERQFKISLRKLVPEDDYWNKISLVLQKFLCLSDPMPNRINPIIDKIDNSFSHVGRERRLIRRRRLTVQIIKRMIEVGIYELSDPFIENIIDHTVQNTWKDEGRVNRFERIQLAKVLQQKWNREDLQDSDKYIPLIKRKTIKRKALAPPGKKGSKLFDVYWLSAISIQTFLDDWLYSMGKETFDTQTQLKNILYSTIKPPRDRIQDIFSPFPNLLGIISFRRKWNKNGWYQKEREKVLCRKKETFFYTNDNNEKNLKENIPFFSNNRWNLFDIVSKKEYIPWHIVTKEALFEIDSSSFRFLQYYRGDKTTLKEQPPMMFQNDENIHDDIEKLIEIQKFQNLNKKDKNKTYSYFNIPYLQLEQKEEEDENWFTNSIFKKKKKIDLALKEKKKKTLEEISLTTPYNSYQNNMAESYHSWHTPWHQMKMKKNRNFMFQKLKSNLKNESQDILSIIQNDIPTPISNLSLDSMNQPNFFPSWVKVGFTNTRKSQSDLSTEKKKHSLREQARLKKKKRPKHAVTLYPIKRSLKRLKMAFRFASPTLQKHWLTIQLNNLRKNPCQNHKNDLFKGWSIYEILKDRPLSESYLVDAMRLFPHKLKYDEIVAKSRAESLSVKQLKEKYLSPRNKSQVIKKINNNIRRDRILLLHHYWYEHFLRIKQMLESSNTSYQNEDFSPWEIQQDDGWIKPAELVKIVFSPQALVPRYRYRKRFTMKSLKKGFLEKNFLWDYRLRRKCMSPNYWSYRPTRRLIESVIEWLIIQYKNLAIHAYMVMNTFRNVWKPNLNKKYVNKIRRKLEIDSFKEVFYTRQKPNLLSILWKTKRLDPFRINLRIHHRRQEYCPDLHPKYTQYYWNFHAVLFPTQNLNPMDIVIPNNKNWYSKLHRKIQENVPPTASPVIFNCILPYILERKEGIQDTKLAFAKQSWSPANLMLTDLRKIVQQAENNIYGRIENSLLAKLLVFINDQLNIIKIYITDIIKWVTNVFNIGKDPYILCFLVCGRPEPIYQPHNYSLYEKISDWNTMLWLEDDEKIAVAKPNDPHIFMAQRSERTCFSDRMIGIRINSISELLSTIYGLYIYNPLMACQDVSIHFISINETERKKLLARMRIKSEPKTSTSSIVKHYESLRQTRRSVTNRLWQNLGFANPPSKQPIHFTWNKEKITRSLRSIWPVIWQTLGPNDVQPWWLNFQWDISNDKIVKSGEGISLYSNPFQEMFETILIYSTPNLVKTRQFMSSANQFNQSDRWIRAKLKRLKNRQEDLAQLLVSPKILRSKNESWSKRIEIAAEGLPMFHDWKAFLLPDDSMDSQYKSESMHTKTTNDIHIHPNEDEVQSLLSAKARQLLNKRAIYLWADLADNHSSFDLLNPEMDWKQVIQSLTTIPLTLTSESELKLYLNAVPRSILNNDGNDRDYEEVEYLRKNHISSSRTLSRLSVPSCIPNKGESIPSRLVYLAKITSYLKKLPNGIFLPDLKNNRIHTQLRIKRKTNQFHRLVAFNRLNYRLKKQHRASGAYQVYYPFCISFDDIFNKKKTAKTKSISYNRWIEFNRNRMRNLRSYVQQSFGHSIKSLDDQFLFLLKPVELRKEKKFFQTQNLFFFKKHNEERLGYIMKRNLIMNRESKKLKKKRKTLGSLRSSKQDIKIWNKKLKILKNWNKQFTYTSRLNKKIFFMRYNKDLVQEFVLPLAKKMKQSDGIKVHVTEQYQARLSDITEEYNNKLLERNYFRLLKTCIVRLNNLTRIKTQSYLFPKTKYPLLEQAQYQPFHCYNSHNVEQQQRSIIYTNHQRILSIAQREWIYTDRSNNITQAPLTIGNNLPKMINTPAFRSQDLDKISGYQSLQIDSKDLFLKPQGKWEVPLKSRLDYPFDNLTEDQIEKIMYCVRPWHYTKNFWRVKDYYPEEETILTKLMTVFQILTSYLEGFLNFSFALIP